MKKIIVSVTNDLVTDQRVDRVCNTLVKMGFEVLLIGRRLKESLPLGRRPYRMKRMRLLFRRGPCFYAEYNIRLFLFLLFRPAGIFLSNDLDTLPANFLAAGIRRKALVYDSHEYYTETPELVNRKTVQAVWRFIEGRIFPRLRHVYTVNGSIAALYSKKYNVPVHVVRNLPCRREPQPGIKENDNPFPPGKKVILLQGAGINMQRGAEEMVEAMRYISGAVFVIIGGGDVIDDLKQQVKETGLSGKVMFIPKVPFEALHAYTVQADIAVTLDKDTNLNYRYSLPNKLFDYIQARVPVLASDLPEIAGIVKQYEIGMLVSGHEPEMLAKAVNNMLNNKERYKVWKENLSFAADELCWENEEKKLIPIFSAFAG
jgi:glycosyltransferase involved in cell wall biosynthesis